MSDKQLIRAFARDIAKVRAMLDKVEQKYTSKLTPSQVKASITEEKIDPASVTPEATPAAAPEQIPEKEF